MTRQSIVAGQFYESDKEALIGQIKECFSSGFGPKGLSNKKIRKEIIGIISPHAGYMFSGPCQAWAYKEIAESALPDTYIMLGLSHNGNSTCLSLEDWATPLGIIKNDKEFQKELSKKIRIDEKAHAYEHSIEVQLPFLQFINKDKDIRISPIIVSSDYKDVASSIFEAIKKTKRKVIIIASSDFTHYGPNYGYIPFNRNIKENMYALDKAAIGKIIALNSEKFLEYIDSTHATICGKYPIACLIELSKKLGAINAKLLHYHTSGDVIDDYSSAVGYAAIKIE
jgi:hypothetical protein